MLNFAINRNESKRFIRYYKEKDDVVIVHYGNHSKEEFKNTWSNRQALNEQMEEQVRNGKTYFTDESSKFRIDSRQYLGRLFFVYSIFTTLVGTVSIPVASLLNLNNVVGTYAFSLTGGLLLLPIKNMIKAINLTKYNLFFNNKNNINQYLINNGKNDLCINDIRNLNIFSVALTTIKANRYNKRLVLSRERNTKINELEKHKTKTLGFSK